MLGVLEHHPHLDLIRRVSETMGVVEMAARLGVTPQAVSKMLAVLGWKRVVERRWVKTEKRER